MKPIRLWSAHTSSKNDDAGIQIITTEYPSLAQETPLYEIPSRTGNGGPSFKRLPKLLHFCIKALVEYPEEVHALGGTRLLLSSDHDVLDSLIPSWSTSKFSIARLDPRLWAVLTQVYSNLPSTLSSYPITLSDKHLPLLQLIPPTPDFALLTVLDLRGNKALDDQTIIALKPLHNLCILDAGRTKISSEGIRRLALTVTINSEGERRGPWALRVLRLVDCELMDGSIFQSFDKFPLLTAIDLRGTKCVWKDIRPPFSVSEDEDFFEPRSVFDAVKHLAELGCHTIPTTNYRTLHVYGDMSKTGPRRRPAFEKSDQKGNPSTTSSMHNSFVVLPASSGSTSSSLTRNPQRQDLRIQWGNADLLDKLPSVENIWDARPRGDVGQKCRDCRNPEPPDVSDSDPYDSELPDVSCERMHDEAYASYLRCMKERGKKREKSLKAQFCRCSAKTRPLEESLETLAMEVGGASDPLSFYANARVKMPYRSLDRMQSMGVIVGRSPPDWSVLENIARTSERRAAHPPLNRSVGTKTSLKDSEKMKAWTDMLGKRKRETRKTESSMVSAVQKDSPPRKTLKPISNRSLPDPSPINANARLKLEPSRPSASSKAGLIARVAARNAIQSGSKRKVGLRTTNLDPQTTSRTPLRATNSATVSIRATDKERLNSETKFNWSSWSRKP